MVLQLRVKTNYSVRCNFDGTPYSVCVLESATTPTTFTTESQSTASTPTTVTESTVSTVTTTATTASTGSFFYFVVEVTHNVLTLAALSIS